MDDTCQSAEESKTIFTSAYQKPYFRTFLAVFYTAFCYRVQMQRLANDYDKVLKGNVCIKPFNLHWSLLRHY